MKHLSIGYRVLIGFALISLLSLGLILPLAMGALGALSDRAESRELESRFLALSGEIATQGELAEALSAVVARMPPVQEAFAAGDRERLSALTSPVFDYMREHYAVSQFQFLTAPATSFLRLHMLDRYGDDLTAIRRTIVEANRTQKPVRGLEIGVAGLGLRGVEPVFHQGRHVGVVEFGMSFGQPFFDRFKARAGADAALRIPDKGGFKTFAGTIEGEGAFDPEELRDIMDGETLTRRMEHGGIPVVAYGRLVGDFSGAPVGVLEIMIDRSQALAFQRQALFSILGLGALLLLGGLALAWFTARGISRPIRGTVESLRSIAEGDGDLTRRLQADGRNELADLARAFNSFVDKVQDLIRQISGISAQLAAAAEELSVTSGQTNQQVRLQQAETDGVATAINEMTATVEEVARHAAEAARVVHETDREADRGDQLARQTVIAIEALAGEIEQAGQVIARLSDDSREIGAVLDVIRGVAEQTNLLALNAAIEAARAGEMGRGFAVVADEVRTLASRTQASIEDIRDKIERVQSGSAGAVRVIEKSEQRARESVEQAKRASESFQSIGRSITSVNDMNTQIASAAEEQSAVAEEINRNIHTIGRTVDQTATGSLHLARASEELARLAAEIQDRIGHFRI
nr:methyl-accepting chemotaxis protein [Thiocystis violacea]